MVQIVREVLMKYCGNRTHTAKELGITVKTLRNWIERNDELCEFRKRKIQ